MAVKCFSRLLTVLEEKTHKTSSGKTSPTQVLTLSSDRFSMFSFATVCHPKAGGRKGRQVQLPYAPGKMFFHGSLVSLLISHRHFRRASFCLLLLVKEIKKHTLNAPQHTPDRSRGPGCNIVPFREARNFTTAARP